MLIGDPGFYGVVAEEAGTIVGSNFMDERSTIFGIGPILSLLKCKITLWADA